MTPNKKLLLIILDGWGLSTNTKANAPLAAKTPVLDTIYKNYPKTSLQASSTEVGLLAGEPGNSEVGHSNIGSGRIVWQNLPKIDQAIEQGELAKNQALVNILDYSRKSKKTLHFVGLVSNGGVHSHIRHLEALLDIAAAKKVDNILVHFISDGRDTPPEKAKTFAAALEKKFAEIKRGRIATLIGRFYAMDRDNNMDRTQKAVDLITKNIGKKYSSFNEAADDNYANGKNDENMEASVIGEGGKIMPGDAIIFFNFRSDRMKQLFSTFTRKEHLLTVATDYAICTLAQYVSDTKVPIIFPPSPSDTEHSLAEVISKGSLNQFHTSETEKYAHVTYFLNSGNTKPFAGEKDILLPSKKQAYDRVPEMSAKEITEQLVGAIGQNHNFIVVNFANGDMVGHTGVFEAAVKGCEVVDNCLGKVLSEASNKGYEVMLVADHGNCDVMVDELSGEPFKEHTANPVPFVFLDFYTKPFAFAQGGLTQSEYLAYASQEPIGVLADISPSILARLGLPQPETMPGMDITGSLDKE